jgi:hypothetical protein
MLRNVEPDDRQCSTWSYGKRAGSSVAAIMTDHDHLVSGIIMLAMAVLAWAMTSLPGLIVTALAVGGGILLLSALDEGVDAQR